MNTCIIIKIERHLVVWINRRKTIDRDRCTIEWQNHLDTMNYLWQLTLLMQCLLVKSEQQTLMTNRDMGHF